MKNRQCNIRISEEFLLALQDCADAEGVTVSEYVRVKMQGVLTRNRNKCTPKAAGTLYSACVAPYPQTARHSYACPAGS